MFWSYCLFWSYCGLCRVLGRVPLSFVGAGPRGRRLTAGLVLLSSSLPAPYAGTSTSCVVRTWFALSLDSVPVAPDADLVLQPLLPISANGDGSSRRPRGRGRADAPPPAVPRASCVRGACWGRIKIASPAGRSCALWACWAGRAAGAAGGWCPPRGPARPGLALCTLLSKYSVLRT